MSQGGLVDLSKKRGMYWARASRAALMDISLEHTVGNPANTDFFNQMYIVNAQQNQVKFTIAAGWSWKGFFLLININVYPKFLL